MLRLNDKRARGFTLLELVIVVIIVAVLAGLGIPQYTKTVERARWSEVPTMLSAIRKACFIYYSQYGVYPPGRYLNGSAKNPPPLDLSLPEPKDGRYIYYSYGDDYSTNPSARCAFGCYDKNRTGTWASGPTSAMAMYPRAAPPMGRMKVWIESQTESK